MIYDERTRESIELFPRRNKGIARLCLTAVDKGYAGNLGEAIDLLKVSFSHYHARIGLLVMTILEDDLTTIEDFKRDPDRAIYYIRKEQARLLA